MSSPLRTEGCGTHTQFRREVVAEGYTLCVFFQKERKFYAPPASQPRLYGWGRANNAAITIQAQGSATPSCVAGTRLS